MWGATTTSALYTVITDSASYPSNAAGIGMKSSGAAPETFFYEGGTLIAYKPAAAPSGAGGFNKRKKLEKYGISKRTDREAESRTRPQ